MRRDCEPIQTLLPAWLDGDVSVETAEQVAAHLTACAACSSLRDALVLSRAGLHVDAPDPQLTASILAQTSGSACDRSLVRLVAHSDGDLEEETGELMRLHLEHCPRCRPLSEVLAWLPPVLTDLRELQPDADFVSDVMVATVGSDTAPQKTPGRLDRWFESLWERWRAWTARPLFAAEAAYAATLLVVLLMGTPVSPFKALPGQALVWLQGTTSEDPQLAGPGAVQEGRGAVRALSQRGGNLVDQTSGGFANWRRDVFIEISRRAHRGGTGLDTAAGGFRELGLAVWGKEGHEIAPALRGIGQGLREFWTGITRAGPGDQPLGPGNEESGAGGDAGPGSVERVEESRETGGR